MFSAKQGHYWYHFYNVFGMTRSLHIICACPLVYIVKETAVLLCIY